VIRIGITRASAPPAPLPGLWLLLAALPVAALPHAWEQPLWVILLVLGAVAGRLWIHAQHTRLPAAWVMILLALGAGALTFNHFGTWFGQEAGTALLLVMVALKLLEIRSERDIVVSLLLGYFVVVTTYFFNQSIGIAAYSLVSTWLLTATLLQVHAGRRLPLARLARASGVMLLQALPIMLILFLLFPRLPGPLWGSPERERTAQTGLSERLEPGDIAQLLENEATALRVRFEGPAPASSRQYWRALVMTDFDGRAWRVDHDRPSGAIDRVGGGTDAPIDVTYTATLEPNGARYLPMLEFAAAAPAGAELLGNHQVLRRHRIEQRIQYTGTAQWVIPEPPPLGPTERARALALPEGTAPRTRIQAGLWRTLHGDDDRAIVDAALTLFAAAPFRYTLRAPPLLRDRTDHFLFETQAGYCEHYASAFAVLMRAAGIPARVITGYQGGQWMDTGRYLRLRQADAHAWTEVWLDEQGWIRVDPTAAIAPERIEWGLSGLFDAGMEAPDFLRRSGLAWSAAWRLRLSDWHDLMTYRWEYGVLAFDPERQRELFARFGLDATDWKNVLLALLVTFGGLGLLAAGLAWLLRPRRPQDPAQRALERLSRRLQRLGLARQPHESAPHYAARVGAAHPELASALTAFAEAHTQLRYANLSAIEQAQFAQQLAHTLHIARVYTRWPQRRSAAPCA